MRKLLSRSIVLFALLLCSVASFANSPVATLQGVADRMITQLEKHRTELNNPAVIHQIVDVVLVPYVDMNRMAGMVVGRQMWYGATSAQRHEFVNQFKHLVVNTYANALASYDDDHVQVYPLRDGSNGRFVDVRSVVLRKSGQRIVINYHLVQVGGQWKVYDFSIEGVSIIQNFRSQFANTLATGGMAALINKLQAYNRGR